jgi:hypothetical protein
MRPLQKCPDRYFLSFQRKQVSSEFNYLWIPVFTGMTALLEFCKGLIVIEMLCLITFRVAAIYPDLLSTFPVEL